MVLTSLTPFRGSELSQLKHRPLAIKVCLRKPGNFLSKFLYEPFFFFLTWPKASVQTQPSLALTSKVKLSQSLSGLRQYHSSQNLRNIIPEGTHVPWRWFTVLGSPQQDIHWLATTGQPVLFVSFPPRVFPPQGS